MLATLPFPFPVAFPFPFPRACRAACTCPLTRRRGPPGPFSAMEASAVGVAASAPGGACGAAMRVGTRGPDTLLPRALVSVRGGPGGWGTRMGPGGDNTPALGEALEPASSAKRSSVAQLAHD